MIQSEDYAEAPPAEDEVVAVVQGDVRIGTAPLRESQFDTLALLLLAGCPPDQCAEKLGVSRGSVTWHLNRRSEAFNQVFSTLRDEKIRRDTHFHNDMAKMVQMGIDAYMDALTPDTNSTEEKKLRLTAAKDLFDRIYPANAKAAINLELTQNNVTMNGEVGAKIKEISGQFVELFNTALGQDPTKHIRVGADALPSATAPPPIEVTFTSEPAE